METSSLIPAVVPQTLGLANSTRAWETRQNLHDDMTNHPNFIEGPTHQISMEDLTTKNVIPTFADNTLIVSHQQFIETVRQAAMCVFGPEVTGAEVRVSHPIIGRTPEAQHKKVSELLDHEKTIFYQRMAWIAQISNLTTTINGEPVTLTIGGTRSLHEDKLYGRATTLKFRVFCGLRVRVCSNLMLTCDGVSGVLNCATPADIFQKTMELFGNYNIEKDLELLESLRHTFISQQDFCKVVGRMRLYQALPTAQQKLIGKLNLGDSIANAAVKEYATNPAYGVGETDGTISMWDFLQIFTEATKSSYPDLAADRLMNCTELATGIRNSLRGETNEYNWFLN